MYACIAKLTKSFRYKRVLNGDYKILILTNMYFSSFANSIYLRHKFIG